MNRFYLLFLAALVVAASPTRLEAGKLSLFAGGGTRETGPATACRLADPFAIAFDADGNAFVCEMTNNRVLRIDSTGMLTVVGGGTGSGNRGDGGPAANAQFNAPHNLTVGKNGDLYVADTWNWKVRRIDAKTGIISTFAGTGKKAFGGDGGPADRADFSGIYSIAFDAAQENLYIADLENRRVRGISLGRIGLRAGDVLTTKVRTVAGNGQKGLPADGSDAAVSPLVDPRAVAVAKSGEVYILERSGNALRVVDANGKIRTVVGTGKAGPLTATTDPLEATLRGPKHLCVDVDDNVLIADSDNHVIRKYLPRENKLVRVVGTGKPGRSLDIDPLKTELNHPHGVAVDGQGRVYVADSLNGRILRIE